MLIAGIVLVAVLALVMHLLQPVDDGMGRFPHTYLDQAGYDPALVTIVIAPISNPPPTAPGLLNAWECDDPAFADAQGRHWLFPMAMLSGNGPPVPPLHPQLQRRPTLDSCHLYRTPEGIAQLEAFRAKVSK
jgi:hypothetical protein